MHPTAAHMHHSHQPLTGRYTSATVSTALATSHHSRPGNNPSRRTSATATSPTTSTARV
jgi:hypothetical protein